MSNKWLNNEFKQLHIDEDSKIAKQCKDLWIKTKAIANVDALQTEIDNEMFADFEKVSPDKFGVKTINGTIYQSTIKNHDYLKFLKDEIIPILKIIKFELDDTLKYFILIDSFIHLAKQFKDYKQPSAEFVSECILSQPIFNEYWNLLIQKVIINLYSLFDPSIRDTDANFHSLFEKIKKCQIQDIKFSIELRNKKIDISLILENIKNYVINVETIIINNFFKNELHDYVCKRLKHFTTSNVNSNFTINDLFYIFTFAVKHLYWEIVEKLFCISNDWQLSVETIKDLFGENSKNYLFSWTVYCDLDKQLNSINNIWKDGNYFKKIKLASDYWGILSAVDSDQHNISLISRVSDEYRFNTNEALKDNNFNEKAIQTFFKIVKDNKVAENIDYCHSLIEYLSKNNK